MSLYNSDEPIKSIESDKYSRADFAQNIARALLNLDRDKSFVVALYAEWGYGKTSMLNMVQNELKTDPDAIIIKLEPWSYVTEKALAASLFYEISKKLSKDQEGCAKALSLIWSWTRKFGAQLRESLLGTATPLVKTMNATAGAAMTSIGKMSDLLASTDSYNRIRTSIEHAIRDSNKRVIVVIDDIDRLDPDAMLSSFKLIRSVANIRGITYLLAFDEQIVSTSISKKLPDGIGGRDYIEKIVQIPIHLPLIEVEELLNQLNDGILDIFKDNRLAITDDERNEIAEFCWLLLGYFDTPRKVTRCLNALRFSIPLLADKTNTADATRIELLRATRPDLHDKIKMNRNILTQHASSMSQEDSEKLEQYLNEVFIGDERTIVQTLFPNVIDQRNNFFASPVPTAQQQRQQKRICAPEYVGRYFSYSVGKNDIPEDLVSAALQQQGPSQQDFQNLFSSYPHDEVIREIRDRIEHISDVPDFCIQLVLGAEQAEGAFDAPGLTFATINKVLHLVEEILQKHHIDPTQSQAVFETIAKKCHHLETLTYLIRLAKAIFENPDPAKQTLSPDNYDNFKRLILEILDQSMAKKALPVDAVGSVAYQLYAYISIFSESNERNNHYIKTRIKTSTQALDFITQFLGRWTDLETGRIFVSDLLDQGSAPYRQWFDKYFDAKYLCEVLTSDEKYQRYQGLAENNVLTFDRFDRSAQALNRAGNERSDEFRNIIAQQFIYLFEAGQQKESKPSAELPSQASQ